MHRRTEPPPEPLLLTVPEAAQRLRVSRAMVYVLINRASLPTVHLGRAVRIPADRLKRWLEEQQLPAP